MSAPSNPSLLRLRFLCGLMLKCSFLSRSAWQAPMAFRSHCGTVPRRPRTDLFEDVLFRGRKGPRNIAKDNAQRSHTGGCTLRQRREISPETMFNGHDGAWPSRVRGTSLESMHNEGPEQIFGVESKDSRNRRYGAVF